MQETPAIADNAFVFHKHRNQEIRTEIIARRRRKQEGQRNPPGKRDDAFQPFPVAAAIIIRIIVPIQMLLSSHQGSSKNICIRENKGTVAPNHNMRPLFSVLFLCLK